jgi:hypothetical protein
MIITIPPRECYRAGQGTPPGRVRKLCLSQARTSKSTAVFINSNILNKNISYLERCQDETTDQEYGERVARGLGLSVDEVKRLAALSQEERVKATAE